MDNIDDQFLQIISKNNVTGNNLAKLLSTLWTSLLNLYSDYVRLHKIQNKIITKSIDINHHLKKKKKINLILYIFLKRLKLPCNLVFAVSSRLHY